MSTTNDHLKDQLNDHQKAEPLTSGQLTPADGEVTSKVEAAMARVRATTPSAKGAPSVAVTGRQRAGEAFLFPEDLYRNLHQARTIGGALNVDYKLGWRTPIIGPVWMRVRHRIHQEIRIYIDAMTTYQNNLNTHLIRSVALIVETLDGVGLRALKRQQTEQADLVEALRTEVRTLHAHLEAVEARLGALEGQNPDAVRSPGA